MTTSRSPGPDTDLVISTARLDLHTVRPEDYALLAVDRADPRLWVDRGFANPLGHLVEDPGPLPYRLPRIEANPAAAPYLLRVAVRRSDATIVGSAGFHDLPDDDGMIEIGFGVAEPVRRLGFGLEILHGMWGWVVDQPGVRVLRYTVSPDNVASQAIIAGLGFTYQGQQIDDEDGPEDIFELSADEYRRRFVG